MKMEMLKDGTAVLMRPPTMDDLERECIFFRSLTDEDRQFLRFDVTKREVVERLIREAAEGRAYRIDGFVDERIIAHGALEFSSDGWARHIAEIRVMVAPSHRGQRLGTLLIGHLFREAERRGVEKVVMRMAAPQAAPRHVAERLGFHVDAVLPDHVKDSTGKLHPLVVMSCPLDEVARALRDMYKSECWPDG